MCLSVQGQPFRALALLCLVRMCLRFFSGVFTSLRSLRSSILQSFVSFRDIAYYEREVGSHTAAYS
jgi:hypothetical protein